MKTRTIRQQATFKASPHEVFEALMDEKKHAAFTRAAAKVSRKLGGRFTTYDGYADGVNLELVPDRKIVQSWRASDWPAGQYSTTTYLLTPVAGGTRLTFTQSEVPGEQYDDVSQGWRDYYWQALKDWLAKAK
jgi:activator of HSP90 ATPase